MKTLRLLIAIIYLSSAYAWADGATPVLPNQSLISEEPYSLDQLNVLRGHENEVTYFHDAQGRPVAGTFTGTEPAANGMTRFRIEDVKPDTLPSHQSSDKDAKAFVFDSAPEANEGEGRPVELGASGPSLGVQGLEAGGAAALASGVMQGFYYGVVMTPEREARMKQVSDELTKSQAGAETARNELNAHVDSAYKAGVQAANGMLDILQMPPVKVDIAGPEATQLPRYQTQDPKFLEQAVPIQERLNKPGYVSPENRELRNIGNAALTAASGSWVAGNIPVSQAQMDVAKGAADLMVGLDPVTGFVRSGYELFTGHNLITGVELEAWQRALAGAIFTGSLITMGAVTTAASALKVSLGILRELKPSNLGLILGSLRESEKFADGMRALHWSPAKIVRFARFQRNVLGSELRSFKESVRAFETWSNEAKATYRKTFEALTSDSAKIAEEAKTLGIDSETLLERKALAIGYYNNAPRFTGSAEHIAEHIAGIDFSKEIKIADYKRGTQVMTWSNPHSAVSGDYFATQILPPSRLGIGSLALEKGELYAKELRVYEFENDVSVLESSASEMNDTFSIDPDVGDKIPEHFADHSWDWSRQARSVGDAIPGMQYSPGGGKQLFAPWANLKRIK